MKSFECSEPSKDKANDNKQKDSRNAPKFSPLTRADQPSTSAGNEEERVWPKGEPSACSDASIASRKEPEFKREDNRNKNRSSKLEDVINLKKQKRDVYRLLYSLPERSEQATLEASKSKRGAEVPLTDKLKEGALRYIISKEKKRLIEQQREGKVKAVKEFTTHYKSINIVCSAIEVGPR